ncbi:MAG: DUF2723 domain-containing protein [Caldilinea sp.]|nr:DUF2723 domain-containing protein [Caldilinea sp.]
MGKSQPLTAADRQIAFVLGAIVAGLYFRAVPLDLLPGDAGEFQFAAWNFGLAHATGYPLYMIVGGLWQHLWAVIGVSPAASLNLLSAIYGGAAAALLFLLLARALPGDPVPRRLAAALAATYLAANPTFRSQALQAEVYTLQALLLVAVFWAAWRLPEGETPRAEATRFAGLAFIYGLALTHHATALLLAPALLLYLFLWQRDWWRNGRAWALGIPAGLAPLLLYLYVPLRSGPDASPWYHQRLGDGVLTLYTNTWPAFVDFVTGRSISVGFHGAATALDGVSTMLLLWLRHFEWTGLLLIGIGLFVLVRMRNWPVLAMTGVYFVLLQIFNLFYAIGDIFVYYIPLYLVACIWIGYGGAGIAMGFRFDTPPATESAAGPSSEGRRQWGVALLALLFFFPAQLWLSYAPIFDQLKIDSERTRAGWEQLLAAGAPQDAILVSNDRNEIVPLFYFQHVEGRGQGHTGLFPLIAPGARFADIGATLQTALADGAGQPVYLIKPMPGLEARFALAPRTEPLVEVLGDAASTPPARALGLEYGPLRLLGYDWAPTAEGIEVALHWLVQEKPAANYTTTVQLFDASGDKLAQDDRPPGGDFYPTSLWKPGETLVDRRLLTLSEGTPVRMLVGMYSGPDATLLAPPLEIDIDPAGVG